MTDAELRITPVQLERLGAIAASLSIGRLQHHILLCAQQSTPRCAGYEESAIVWRYLKRRLKELDLSSAPPPWRGSDDPAPPTPGDPANGTVLRSKVDCLRVCEQRPCRRGVPRGVCGITPCHEPVMERIIVEHLIGGIPVAEFVFATDDLGGLPS